MNNKTIVIDMDDTISITDQTIPYADRKPKKKVIRKLRIYQSLGFYIIIDTGRQMRTYKGNIGKINIHTLPILIKWLNKYNVPYDEIRVGKQWQGTEGFRVDDSTIRPKEFVKLNYKEIMELLKRDK